MNKSKFFLWCFLTFLILPILAIITRLHIQGRTWISWLFVSFRLLKLLRLIHNFFLKFLIYLQVCLCFALLLIAFGRTHILFWGKNTALKLFINPKTSFQYVLSCLSFFFGIFHHFLRKPFFIKFLYFFIVFFKFLKSCFTPNILLGVKTVR